MSLRILVVDDSSIFRTIIRKAVSLSGLDVGEIFDAANGSEALTILRKEWVDLVFCDLNMPEMGGEELVEVMRGDKVLSSIPVVIVTSDRSKARIEQLESIGVQAYLSKPFRPEEFRDVVRKVLGK